MPPAKKPPAGKGKPFDGKQAVPFGKKAPAGKDAPSTTAHKGTPPNPSKGKGKDKSKGKPSSSGS